MSTISIIGSGGMATAIAGRIARAGHTVEVINRNPAKAQLLVDKLASGAVTGKYGTTPAGEIVILAVPYASAIAVMTDFGAALEGKVIIDITNPFASDLSGLVTPHDSSGAQEIAKCAPSSAHVIKAFNSLFGRVLASDKHLDAFLAGDDADAKSRVSSFIESLGLRPLDVGGLPMARSLEWLGLMMIGLAKNGAGSWDIAMKVDIG
ncbi:NADP oxidoreductase [Pantoea rodasii]|uniref:NADP oxidoreductase n=1 Tax=Pantoea rodasii TaxID=1076549 RepID=A0A2M9WIZ2_9GAMM|nr:NAD(P)-binding domain-containing protein [Pantoea rodasii]ORM61812.1 NADP oxidoreductase [Pantoea rodasii]PJZ07530.1 NADP oxidoreductase [Pantoea rodasii]